MTIHKSVSELIGGTPLVELSNYEKNHNLEATIVGKVCLLYTSSRHLLFAFRAFGPQHRPLRAAEVSLLHVR